MNPTFLLGGELEVRRLGFGAMRIVDDREEGKRVLHRALELGVNWIDTAAAYGFGRSEEVVGRAIRGLAEPPLVFTKCGLLEAPGRTVEHSLRRDSIRRECEASLRRLGVEAIDLYQIHWPDPDEQLEEGWLALAELRDEGKVRHIGVSNFDVGRLERADAIAPVETLQPRFSLLDRGIETEILPWAARHDLGVLVYSPMASGLLTGAMTRRRIEAMPDDDWRKRHRWFREPQLSENLELVERLRAAGEPRGASPGAVAVAWALAQPGVTAAIVGFRRPDQVDGILPAAAEPPPPGL